MNIQDYADNIQKFLTDEVGNLPEQLKMLKQHHKNGEVGFDLSTIKKKIISLYRFNKNENLKCLILSALIKASELYNKSTEENPEKANSIVKYCSFLTVSSSYLGFFSYLLHQETQNKTTGTEFTHVIVEKCSPFLENLANGRIAAGPNTENGFTQAIDIFVHVSLGRYLANIKSLAHAIAALCNENKLFIIKFDEPHSQAILASLGEALLKSSQGRIRNIDHTLYRFLEWTCNAIEINNQNYNIESTDAMSSCFDALWLAYRTKDADILPPMQMFIDNAKEYRLSGDDGTTISMKISPFVGVFEIILFCFKNKSPDLSPKSRATTSSSQASSSVNEASLNPRPNSLFIRLWEPSSGSPASFNGASIADTSTSVLNQAVQACEVLISTLDSFLSATINSPTSPITASGISVQPEATAQLKSILQGLTQYVPVILEGLVAQINSAMAPEYGFYMPQALKPKMSLQYAQLLFALSLILSAELGNELAILNSSTAIFSLAIALLSPPSSQAKPTTINLRSLPTLKTLDKFLPYIIQMLNAGENPSLLCKLDPCQGTAFCKSFEGSIILELTNALTQQWQKIEAYGNTFNNLTDISSIVGHLLLHVGLSAANSKITLNPEGSGNKKILSEKLDLASPNFNLEPTSPENIDRKNDELTLKVSASALPEAAKAMFTAMVSQPSPQTKAGLFSFFSGFGIPKSEISSVPRSSPINIAPSAPGGGFPSLPKSPYDDKINHGATSPKSPRSSSSSASGSFFENLFGSWKR